jgi:hypothetical protein
MNAGSGQFPSRDSLAAVGARPGMRRTVRRPLAIRDRAASGARVSFIAVRLGRTNISSRFSKIHSPRSVSDPSPPRLFALNRWP